MASSLVDAMALHQAIHSNGVLASVRLQSGEEVAIKQAKNGCYSANIGGVTFMAQNTSKASTYATRAKKGHRLTWVMTFPKWGLICDKRVEIRCKFFPDVSDDDAADAWDQAAAVTGGWSPLAASSSASVGAKRPASSTTTSTKKAKAAAVSDVDEGTASSTGGPPALELRTAVSSFFKAIGDNVDRHEVVFRLEYPATWQAPLNCTRRVEVARASEEFKNVEKLLSSSATASHKSRFKFSSFKVNSVKRFQHPVLWSKYFLQKQEVIENNGGAPEKITGVATQQICAESNEYYLFHGCNFNIVDKILQNGFDERLSNLRGLFGSGVYFAENSTKSLQYTHAQTCAQIGAIHAGSDNLCSCLPHSPSGSGKRVIFLSRVLLGTPWLRQVATDKTNPLRRPPEKPDGHLYDSVIGEAKKWDKQAMLEFREYIVYDRRHCYPEYIVEFELE